MKKIIASIMVLLVLLWMGSSLTGQVMKKPVYKKPVIKFKRKLPDLQVKKLWLSADCNIYMKIVNNGPGHLKPSAYDLKNGAAIQMYRNGKPWGGIRLGAIDKNKVLKNPGSGIVHKWFPGTANLQLPAGGSLLKVTVDNNHVVKEHNELNNTLMKKVACKAYISQVFPDSCPGSNQTTMCFEILGSNFGNTQGNTLIVVNSQVVPAGSWSWLDSIFYALVPTSLLNPAGNNVIYLKRNGVLISNKKIFSGN